MEQVQGDVTRLLIEMKERQQHAAPKLFELLYDKLRNVAQHHLRRERSDHTLGGTALVHETYLRLADAQQHWRDRAHFFAIASSAMRRILVDHARAKRAAKRPGSQQRADLDEVQLPCGESYDEVIMVDLALEQLSQIDPRQARIVELRYFGGFTAEEVAEALGISIITVHRDWAVARAWLHGEMAGRKSVRVTH